MNQRNDLLRVCTNAVNRTRVPPLCSYIIRRSFASLSPVRPLFHSQTFSVSRLSIVSDWLIRSRSFVVLSTHLLTSKYRPTKLQLFDSSGRDATSDCRDYTTTAQYWLTHAHVRAAGFLVFIYSIFSLNRFRARAHPTNQWTKWIIP